MRFSAKYLWIAAALASCVIPGCGSGPGSTGGGGGGGGGGGNQSKIQHLVIVMMQNHSFDNLFGSYPGGTGLNSSDSSYHQVDKSGKAISPTLLKSLSTSDLNHTRDSYLAAWNHGKMNKYASTNGDLAMRYYDNTVTGKASDGRSFGINTLWSYAQKYALADNFFASAMNSEPANELYMVAATIHDDQTSGSLPYYDPCSSYQQSQNGADSIAVPLKETNIGDQLSSKNVSWTWYQENYKQAGSGDCNDYVPQENVFQYFSSTANSEHIKDFYMPTFQSTLDSGSLPSVVWIQGDGLHDMHPGGGNILDSIEWLDNIVEAIKKSSAWSSTAIVVLWDESGGWYDHVAPPQLSNTQGLGARVPVIVLSPLAKSGYISHQQMDFVSILRFIQWNWDLGEFSASDQAAREGQSGDLCDLLTAACGAP